MLKTSKFIFFNFYNKLILKYLYLSCLTICLLFLSDQTNAQSKEDEDGGIENTEIVIEKNKKIVFPEMPRKFEKIATPQKKINLDPKEYTYKELPTPIADLETKIKISTIKDELNSKKKINYIKGGIGNYITTYLEGQLLMKNNSKYQIGLHARHFGSILGPVANSLTSSNTIEGHAKYFFPKSILSATADYNNSVVNYYGYDHSLKNNGDSKFQDSIKQVYQHISVKMELTQVDTLKKLQYNVKANYFNFSNRFKNSENEVEINGKFSYAIDDVSKIHVFSNISASNYSDSTGSLSRYLFNIRPEYERALLNDRLKVRGGFNIAYDNDTLSSAKQLHFYPVISADLQALEKLFIFAGLDGGMEKNLYRTFANQNPFIGLNPTLVHTNKQYEFYAGLKGNIINTIYFTSSISFNQYQNLSLFVNSVEDNSKFKVIYDNSSLVKLKTEVSYQPTQVLQIGLRGTYFHYKMQHQNQAWHRPSFDITSYASYNMFNKIWFSTEVYYLGSLKAINYKTGSEISLNDIVDINLTTNYKINDRFSVFLYFYNILSQNYQRYNQYQSKGITVMGGLTFTF